MTQIVLINADSPAMFQIGQYRLHSAVDTDLVGVDAEVVVLHAAPFAVRVELVVFRAFFVDVDDALLYLFPREIESLWNHRHFAADALLKASVYETVDGVHVAEDIVGAASHHDAGAAFGEASYQL